MNKMNKFHVYLHGKLIDIVFFEYHYSKDVKESLINHDGYNSNIIVKKMGVL